MLLNCGVGGDSWQSVGQPGVKPVSPKGNQAWMFTGRTDAEAETPILWLPEIKNDALFLFKSWLIGEKAYAGTDWRQEEGTTEDEMVGWHHQLNGHEFEQIPGEGKEQGSLSCCSPWGHKQSDMTEWLNNNNKRGKQTYCVMTIIIKDVDKTRNLSGNPPFVLALESLVISSKIKESKRNVSSFLMC